MKVDKGYVCNRLCLTYYHHPEDRDKLESTLQSVFDEALEFDGSAYSFLYGYFARAPLPRSWRIYFIKMLLELGVKRHEEFHNYFGSLSIPYHYFVTRDIEMLDLLNTALGGLSYDIPDELIESEENIPLFRDIWKYMRITTGFIKRLMGKAIEKKNAALVKFLHENDHDKISFACQRDLVADLSPDTPMDIIAFMAQNGFLMRFMRAETLKKVMDLDPNLAIFLLSKTDMKERPNFRTTVRIHVMGKRDLNMLTTFLPYINVGRATVRQLRRWEEGLLTWIRYAQPGEDALQAMRLFIFLPRYNTARLLMEKMYPGILGNNPYAWVSHAQPHAPHSPELEGADEPIEEEEEDEEF